MTPTAITKFVINWFIIVNTDIFLSNDIYLDCFKSCFKGKGNEIAELGMLTINVLTFVMQQNEQK